METMEEIVEQPIEQEGGEVEQTQDTQPSAQDQQRQADKEYSNWLKGLKEDGDAGKYYKRLKSDHERLRELQRIDPKGLDGVRSRYETLNGSPMAIRPALTRCSRFRKLWPNRRP